MKLLRFLVHQVKETLRNSNFTEVCAGFTMDNYLKYNIVGVKRVAAAAERNKEPILGVLKGELRVVPQPGLVLEVSSGAGQHVAHFAPHFPDLTFQPSELEARQLDSIRAYIKDDALTNVKDPVTLDASAPSSQWVEGSIQPGTLSAIININLIHISPFACAQGLFRGAGELLAPGGRLITYGPYAYNGVITPESNQEFDRNLRATDPSWGIRDVHQELEPLANAVGLRLLRVHKLPANNQLLVWEKSSL